MVMANYLRNPQDAPPPAGVEERRLAIYRDLVYNNIEGFISSGFPVLRSLYRDDDWHSLVRLFIDGHRCQTPYFLEISQEFLRFLLETLEPRPCDPPFAAELAHYEWVELALEVAEDELPEPGDPGDIPAGSWRLSPLAWVLSYHYPVHRIGPGYRPDAPGDPVFLAVYRNRDDAVQFMELNAASARLLELLRDNGLEGSAPRSGDDILMQLAQELGTSPETMREFGAGQLGEFARLGLICR
jgi:hypothetical protein